MMLNIDKQLLKWNVPYKVSANLFDSNSTKKDFSNTEKFKVICIWYFLTTWQVYH